MMPIEFLRRGVASFEPYLRPSGEIVDPIFDEPTQYGTPFHALCRAVLAAKDPDSDRDRNIEIATKGLDLSLAYVEDPDHPSPAANIQRHTGSVSTINHRDFYWPPIMKTYALLRELEPSTEARFSRRISAVDVPAAFNKRPPSNWASVWVSGEWARMQAGLSPHGVDQLDRWLAVFFENHILVEQGLYQEPGHPNSYDLFTRLHLADILTSGYEGRWKAQMARLLETGLRRSLQVQLSDGSLASAYRSTGLTWTVGAECAYFALAAGFFRGRDERLSRAAAEAGRYAYSSFVRWQRPAGPYSPAENVLPPGYRVGYEAYTADAHHGNLPLAFLALAVLRGLDAPEIDQQETPGGGRAHRVGTTCGNVAGSGANARTEDDGAIVFIEDDPTYRALVHAGCYSVHVNAFPSPLYDGFGIVDITFGPGRFFHFVSSVRHLAAPGFYNVGLATRDGNGRSPIHPISQADASLIGRIEPGTEAGSLHLRARIRGEPHVYQMRLRVDSQGIAVSERVGNLRGYKTLLIPYLRDCGSGTATAVTWKPLGEETRILLRMGNEAVAVLVRARVDHIVDLPYGYENRRGLCGLLRVDMADESEGIAYRISVVD